MVNGRFFSTDHDSVEESFSHLEETEKHFLGDDTFSHFYRMLGEYEFGIVTVSTSEITSEGEDDSRDLPRIV